VRLVKARDAISCDRRIDRCDEAFAHDETIDKYFFLCAILSSLPSRQDVFRMAIHEPTTVVSSPHRDLP
jgi:hypothetical protein